MLGNEPRLAGVRSRSRTLDTNVTLRLSRDQRDELACVAHEMGLSLSGYLRRVVLGQPLPPRRPPRPIPELNREAYVELGRIGANLNQLVNALNERGLPGREQILEILELLTGALGEIRARLIGAEPMSSASREID